MQMSTQSTARKEARQWVRGFYFVEPNEEEQTEEAGGTVSWEAHFLKKYPQSAVGAKP